MWGGGGGSYDLGNLGQQVHYSFGYLVRDFGTDCVSVSLSAHFVSKATYVWKDSDCVISSEVTRCSWWDANIKELTIPLTVWKLTIPLTVWELTIPFTVWESISVNSLWVKVTLSTHHLSVSLSTHLLSILGAYHLKQTCCINLACSSYWGFPVTCWLVWLKPIDLCERNLTHRFMWMKQVICTQSFQNFILFYLQRRSLVIKHHMFISKTLGPLHCYYFSLLKHAL